MRAFINAAVLLPRKRRRRQSKCTIHARRGRSHSRGKDRRRRGAENEAELPPVPRRDDYVGREEEYWRAWAAHEKAVRGPHIDRFDAYSGAPTMPEGAELAADVRWDEETRSMRRTTGEERAELLADLPAGDPFWIGEAETAKGYKPDRSRAGFPASECITLEPTLYPMDGGAPEPVVPSVHVEGNVRVERAAGYTRRSMPADAPLESGPPVYRPLVADVRRRPLQLEAGEWRVVHLGTSSAVPTQRRNVSSTAFLCGAAPAAADVAGAGAGASGEPTMVLVDAGEATDARLLDAFWCMSHGLRWIAAVCVTHMHGDHIYGLPGLLRTIGEVCYARRRDLREGGCADEEPVVRIFGPPGIRNFLRISLFWTQPLGVRFAVSELTPRAGDFAHCKKPSGLSDIILVEDGVERVLHDDDEELQGMPPPHPEEVRVDDIEADASGVWRIFGAEWAARHGFDVVAAPLKHRVPCFGYVFEGRRWKAAVELRIDAEKARVLGVHGRQYAKLRRGESVTTKASGLVTYDDVRAEGGSQWVPDEEKPRRKVVLMGDTCDSSLIANAASRAQLLMHEATFGDECLDRAKQAMHSTAGMAGDFARRIGAEKLVLTHFSSRYENGRSDGVDDDDNDDLVDPNSLVAQAARRAPKSKVMAATDYMEHTIALDGTVRTDERNDNRYATYNRKRRWSEPRGPKAAAERNGAEKNGAAVDTPASSGDDEADGAHAGDQVDETESEDRTAAGNVGEVKAY